MHFSNDCHGPPAQPRHRPGTFIANLIAALRRTHRPVYSANLGAELLATMLEHIESCGGEAVSFRTDDFALPYTVLATCKPCPDDVCREDHRVDPADVAGYLEHWAISNNSLSMKCTPRFLSVLNAALPEPVGEAL